MCWLLILFQDFIQLFHSYQQLQPILKFYTLAFFDTKLLTEASPKPEAPPVTITTLFSIFIKIS